MDKADSVQPVIDRQIAKQIAVAHSPTSAGVLPNRPAGIAVIKFDSMSLYIV